MRAEAEPCYVTDGLATKREGITERSGDRKTRSRVQKCQDVGEYDDELLALTFDWFKGRKVFCV
jgi:hypothetical protein